MKITLKKVYILATSDPKPGLPPRGDRWEFVNHPGISLCKEIEHVLNLRDVPTGTIIELNIDKFCVIPPGGC